MLQASVGDMKLRVKAPEEPAFHVPVISGVRHAVACHQEKLATWLAAGEVADIGEGWQRLVWLRKSIAHTSWLVVLCLAHQASSSGEEKVLMRGFHGPRGLEGNLAAKRTNLSSSLFCHKMCSIRCPRSCSSSTKSKRRHLIPHVFAFESQTATALQGGCSPADTSCSAAGKRLWPQVPSRCKVHLPHDAPGLFATRCCNSVCVWVRERGREIGPHATLTNLTDLQTDASCMLLYMAVLSPEQVDTNNLHSDECSLAADTGI